ncbi:Ras-associating (RA) domain [Trinorchestia longiramus]|nr:Ras-associating (RA) domain [Trinorchestia longiramus]
MGASPSWQFAVPENIKDSCQFFPQSHTAFSPPGPTAPLGDTPAPSAAEILQGTLEQQIDYGKNSSNPLPKGLYLGYLKLQSSMEHLKVLVPRERPNMFPCTRIRENTHVSKEEWEWVQQLGSNKESPPSPAQKVWQEKLASAADKLLKDLGVNQPGVRDNHRLYSGEVLDFGDVSLILMFPPSESLFCNPGQEDALLNKPELLALPIHTFEIVHLSTYQSQLLGRYARLSCILEMDKLVAEHAKREAFSQEEINATRQRLTQVQKFQDDLDEAWKQLRWVKDAISFARDKACLGVPLSSIKASLPTPLTASRSQLSSVSSHRLSDASSPPSSPPFHSHLHHSSSDSINFGADKKRFCKSDDRLQSSRHRTMKKSSTAENVRVTPKAQLNFTKSKTSDCLYHGDVSNSHSNPYCTEPTSLKSFMNWATEAYEPKMYRKDQVTTRSEYQIADSIAPEGPLPRKASAPPCLDGRDSNDTEQLASSNNESTLCDSLSIDSIFEPVTDRRRKDQDSFSTRKASSSGRSALLSCYDIPYSFNTAVHQEVNTAGSSSEHESEASFPSMTTSLKSFSSTETETDALSLMSRDSGRSETSEPKSGMEGGEDLESGRKLEETTAIKQVYAAYDTGLAKGVSVKLKVNSRTTARDVIDLVVRQLNMAVVLKGKSGPTYGNDKLKNFCLVAVINKRERCLRDDFKLLHLQDPWRQGKLYVRMKSEILAALEHCSARQSGGGNPQPPEGRRGAPLPGSCSSPRSPSHSGATSPEHAPLFSTSLDL